MTHYRVALIGTGAFAAYHIEALRQFEERLTVIAAANLDAAVGNAFCEKYGIPAFYTSTAELLAHEHPDLVVICTPPGTHVELVIQALEAGVHVLCEKPLCRSLAELDRMQAAEARSGRFLSNIFQWRFGSAAQYVKQMMQAGTWGKPLLATCLTLWYRNDAYYTVPWRSKWATSGGGTTMGLGIHLMDLMFWLMGDWREVQAVIGTLNHDIEVDDVSMALVKFENGALGSIANSAVSPRQETHLRLDFQQATVEVNGVYSAGNDNWTIHELPGPTPIPLLTSTNTPGTLPAQIRVFLDSLDRGERPPVSGNESRRILEFTTALYQSAFTDQPVQRASLTPDNRFYHSMTGAR